MNKLYDKRGPLEFSEKIYQTQNLNNNGFNVDRTSRASSLIFNGHFGPHRSFCFPSSTSNLCRFQHGAAWFIIKQHGSCRISFFDIKRKKENGFLLSIEPEIDTKWIENGPICRKLQHTHGWNHSWIWHRKCFPKVDWPKCTNTPHTLFLPLSLIHQVFFSWIGEKPKRSFPPYRWGDSGRYTLIHHVRIQRRGEENMTLKSFWEKKNLDNWSDWIRRLALLFSYYYYSLE